MNHHPADVTTIASRTTLENVRRFLPRHVAEIGCNKGATSLGIACLLAEREDTSLHLFDFAAKVDDVTRRIKATGFERVYGYRVSDALHDCYNWNLMGLLRQRDCKFDYVFIDGAHTWNIDALAFLLVDRLLFIGGLVEFDDYDWCIERSPTFNPRIFPMAAKLFTEEQMRARQVALIVDLLVKPDPRYEELVANRLYRKIA